MITFKITAFLLFIGNLDHISGHAKAAGRQKCMAFLEMHVGRQ